MDGILLVDKPRGMTSHDVVDAVRRRFRIKKVGHAGTLDPMATGVLVLLLGSYTKASNSFLNDDKEYEATMVLGASSDTGDAWGKLAPSGKDINFTREQIEEVFKRFLGEIEQTPPMYSAVKFKGKKLYELARKGKEVTVGAKRINIKRLEITGIELPEITFRILCSKGTYVRRLCMDIGDALGCGAYLSRLRRIASGAFSEAGTIEFEKIRAMETDALAARLLKR